MNLKQIKYMKSLLKEQKESRAKDISHLFQRDGLSYEDFKWLIDENEKSFKYLEQELRSLK